jgi:Ser/Thr protein kinase RdoA (MazF antagonist)
MKALKKFHDTISQPSCFQSNYALDYWPFCFIEATELITNPHTPKPFKDAYSIVMAFSKRLAPWFSAHKSVCHGDFHYNNVLLDSNGRPLLIDFDTVEYGHPFFDVAKFTVGFNVSIRMALLKTYLGEREPTQEEAEHFSIMTNVELIVDSTIKFEDLSHANQLQQQDNPEAKSKFDNAMGNINEFLRNTKNYVTT